MFSEMEQVGGDWLCEVIAEIAESIEHMTPVQFNEAFRYLPSSVSARPGPFSFSLTPYMREIANCADQRVAVTEVNLLKGVQVGYTTLLECVLFYYIAFIKTSPCMLVSADRELVKGRLENCILPMLQQSGMADLIQSSDEGNSRKTGKTENHLQWQGGGFLIPGGANNADKMRMWSIQLMLKDELDAWPHTVGKDGDPDKLTDARCDTFADSKKIFRGGTPLIKETSKIYEQYLKGDQREYRVPCNSCGHKQALVFNKVNKETGQQTGLVWEYDADGVLDPASVRYLCVNCGHPHHEHDKTRMFKYGEWVPTATPKRFGVRSYKLPALYSPYGFRSWADCVSDYLEAYDPIDKTVRNIGKYQVFYNNVLAEPFESFGHKLRFESVSGHRRGGYMMGTVPNRHALEYTGSKILFLVATIDVHKTSLAVLITGWTAGGRSYVVHYGRIITTGDCGELSDKAWSDARHMISEQRYEGDDGSVYGVALTLVDAGYANKTVCAFCAGFPSSVYPILGRDRPSKNAAIREFSPFTTQHGSLGYKIVVDHYKDAMEVLLRREWHEEYGTQGEGHFNAPVDMTDDALRELTVESRVKRVSTSGYVSYYWHRPSGAANELWDTLGYAMAAVDIIAWGVCVGECELEKVEFAQFWEFAALADNNDRFVRHVFEVD